MTGSDNRWLQSRDVVGDAYDARYERAAQAGSNVHGEADFLMRLSPSSVLDAGCGTGRVARELARRGVEVVGVDLDDEMLATARRKAPDLEWHLGDISLVDLGRTFSTVVAAGNVMILLAPGTESAVVANLAAHVEPGGHLVAGFQVSPDLPTDRYDRIALDAGLTFRERWSSWERSSWDPSCSYIVSVHRR